MPQLDRFTVSLDTELLAALDTHLISRGYANRSEAVRDMIRDLLLQPRLDASPGNLVVTLTLVCQRTTSDAGNRLRSVLHTDADVLRGQLLLPLDAERDVMVIVLSGPAKQLQSVCDRIQALRGITVGSLFSIPEP